MSLINFALDRAYQQAPLSYFVPSFESQPACQSQNTYLIVGHTFIHFDDCGEG